MDLVGQKFARLTVVSRVGSLKGDVVWLCACDCGGTKQATTGKLRYGHVRSCGCLVSEAAKLRGQSQVKNRVGERVGRWTVLKYLDIASVSDDKHKEARWLCRCDCGVERIVRSGNLISGGSKSCGCLALEKASFAARLNFAERIALNTLPVGRSNAYAIFKSYMRGAKLRHLQFELTLDDFVRITSSDCAYCGTKPSRVSDGKRSNGPWVYNGIDRVDNSRGYISGNMVPCCTRCNSAKKNYLLTDFLGWVERVYNLRIKEAQNAARAS